MRRIPRLSRLSRLSRTGTAIAALTVAALVPLCGVAQAAPSDDVTTSVSTPAPSADHQGGHPAAQPHRLLKLGSRDGLLGLGKVLGVL
jgi:hypothetical protein